MRLRGSASIVPVVFVCLLAACQKPVKTTTCDANCEVVTDSGPADSGPDDAGPPPCEPGLTQCGMTCTDLNSDLQNCNACGMACPANNVCNAGACSAIPSTCTTTATGCPSGSTCNINGRTPKCQVGCTGDSDCASTQICSNMKCVTGCRTDTDCSNTASGYICSANACTLPCVDNSSCPAGDSCSGSGHCLPGADGGGIAYPAPFAAPPQVIDFGGPILSTPKLVPIFFLDGVDGGVGGDSPGTVTSLTAFTSNIGASAYWKEAMADWMVGESTAVTPVDATSSDLAELSQAGTVTDNQIQGWLGQKLADNVAGWPVPDDNTVYIVYFPTGVTVSIPAQGGGTSLSCQQFGGYHSNFTIGRNGQTNVAYAVVPRCGSFDGFTGIDAVSGTSSHEIAEASTDPYPQTDPAWASVDNAHIFWEEVLGGGEVGDMCAQDPQAFNKFPPFPFTVQRIWSNTAALAGTDPCIPELPHEVYFNSAMEQNDVITLNLGGEVLQFNGVHIPVNTSRTVPIDLFSEGDTGGPWTVKVEDFAALMGQPAELNITQDTMTGGNGDKIQATISPIAQSSSGGVEFILIVSSQGLWTHLWVAAVGN